MNLSRHLFALILLSVVLPLAAENRAAETAESSMRPVLMPATGVPDQEPDPRGGRVLRFPELDLRGPGAAFHTDGRPVWRFREDHHGRPAYVLEFGDRRHDPFTDWSTSARHPLPLLANRSYVISVLLRAEFPRPAEVNLGVKFVDHGGKQVIWALNGLPNRTDGWQRWEWRITTDPRTTHGVFSILLIGLPLTGTELALGDVALVELPPSPLRPLAPGEGVVFRGGPGGLPMRVESVNQDEQRVTVQTTGATYTFDTADNVVIGEQRLEKQREVVRWKSSLPLKDLRVVQQTAKECVLTNGHLTFGVQCDGLVMVVPHREWAVTARSAVGGRWNRLAAGHLLVVDDYGGFAVNPDIPAGSGRLARVHVGLPWAGLQPGRHRPGAVDFSGTADDNTSLSEANAGWEITWHLSPGERIGLSVFPPRPYPWKDSFEFSWLLARRGDRLDGYRQRRRGPQHVELLWDFLQRGWAMSWGPRHEPYDEALLHDHVRAIHETGSLAAVYASAHWYYSRDPEEFAAEIQRLRDAYRLDGIYYDGIPSQEWVVAYEQMRLTRELFPDGPVIIHNTGQAYNGNPPLGEPSLRIPAIETYATVTYAGELVHGVGADWPFLRYSASQYRVANCIGVMKGDAWEGVTPLQKDLAMLRVNGRNQYRRYPVEYYEVLQLLQNLWEKHGHTPDFFENHYLPAVHEWTADHFETTPQ